MSKQVTFFLTALCVSTHVALCSEKTLKSDDNEAPPLHLTGYLRVDFFGQREMERGPRLYEQSEASLQTGRKSPWLAAGLSLALPGAGELYAESYWKSAAFFTLEVEVWVVAYTYDKKGDRRTEAFQNFADQNWNVVEYAKYAQNNLTDPGQSFNWLIPGTEGRPPWEQVDWAELNRMERAIGATEPGRYYSHTLPLHGEQQYYELIGKYPQYNQGWNDAPPTFRYGDPITPNFQFYSGERGKANDFYSVASTAVTIAILNHVLSAIDAVWSVSTYNNLRAEVGMGTTPAPDGMALRPVLKLSYAF